MKIKCDFCEVSATGTVDQFIDEGWSRVIFFAPLRKTITACKDHIEEFNRAIILTLPERVRRSLTRDPIPETVLSVIIGKTGFFPNLMSAERPESHYFSSHP